MLTAAEQDQIYDGEAHRDPCREAAASLPESIRVSEYSDSGLQTGLHRTHRQHPSEIMITLIMWTL
jgi:hypothetical protein